MVDGMKRTGFKKFKKPPMLSEWIPKVGETVVCCYDGKIGRAVLGVIKSIDEPCLMIEFKEWASIKKNQEPIQCTFRPTDQDMVYETYVKSEISFMAKMFGLPGDYYTAIPLQHAVHAKPNKFKKEWEKTQS